MDHFFIFGCWNRDNCFEEKQLDYRKAVIEKILEKKDYFDFGIITGDNIYPHKQKDKKDKKNKKYYQKTLDYGFGLLKNLQENTKKNIIYGTIGNHDIDLPNILNEQIKSNVLTIPNNVFTNYDDDNKKKLRIVCIDTNLFAEGWDESDDNVLFKSTFINGDYFYKIKNVNELLNYLDTIKKEAFNGWTIIIGHEPIISIKLKGSNYNPKNLNNYETLLEKLASIPRAVYMCADIHSFQAWNIKATNETTLPMIVVGTGGAEPDNTIDKKGKYNHEGYIMELLATEYPYGYCDVSYDDENLLITYIPLNKCKDKSKVEYYFKYNIDSRQLDLLKENTQLEEHCIDVDEIEKYLCEENEVGLIKGGSKNKLYNEIYNGIYKTFEKNRNLIPKGFHL